MSTEMLQRRIYLSNLKCEMYLLLKGPQVHLPDAINANIGGINVKELPCTIGNLRELKVKIPH